MKSLIMHIVIISLLFVACNTCNGNRSTPLVKENFQIRIDGIDVSLYKLHNRNGMEVFITNYGARIVSILFPDKSGDKKDLVLGFDNINDYMTVPNNFGATIGRYANRIDKGHFVIDKDTVVLPQNDYPHCLHGGEKGWHCKAFKVDKFDDNSIVMSVFSPDGDQGFPGNVNAQIEYRLNDDNELHIFYSAVTDKATVVNMTNHSYFNLSGNHDKSVMDHKLYVNSTYYTPIDSTLMTTGEFAPVDDSPFDFSSLRVISSNIDIDNWQIKNGNGFDHNWVLKTDGDINKLAAKLSCPETGIEMEVFTTEPGIQIYTGNFLNGTVKGKYGIWYPQHSAICLETQHYPDSPNKKEWPSTMLDVNKKYESHTIYKFYNRPIK